MRAWGSGGGGSRATRMYALGTHNILQIAILPVLVTNMTHFKEECVHFLSFSVIFTLNQFHCGTYSSIKAGASLCTCASFEPP